MDTSTHAKSSSTLLAPEERVLTTLNADGSRNWLHPRLSRGSYLRQRRLLAWILIAAFTLIPYLRVGGKPLMLFDFVRREFTVLGLTFLPTDTVLLALFLLIVFLTVFLLTALWGRVWCGWACPQTVYMEFVYRPIERLFCGTRGRGGKPSRRVSGWRRAAMYAAYLLISMFLAHTFLAYFVGVEALLRWVQQSPLEHPGSFLLMVGVTAGMMFDFAFFREQTCIVACPYGRFQSVLLDRQSLIISYDERRGEPRGKGRRLPVQAAARDGAALAPAPPQAPGGAARGDCVDCGLCVATCPTGIDIRRGLQMECIACTQCIDACDAVMERIGRPKGLIRYGSQAGMAGESRRLLRPRVILYPALLAVVLVIFLSLLGTRPDADVTILRNVGVPFVRLPDGRIGNTLKLKITNRTEAPASYVVEPVGGADVELRVPEELADLRPGETRTVGILAAAGQGVFHAGHHTLTLRVRDQRDFRAEFSIQLLGPSVEAP